MFRTLSTSALGLLAAGATLAVPEASPANPPVGVNVRIGNFGFTYQDYACAPAVGVYAAPVYRYPVADPYRLDRFAPVAPRVIVHPERTHWTPGHGWHTHGHFHVPTPYGVHTRPY
jgi:hypothetical protein